jgi:acetyltransferase-like isoleucine patch superfamily enzyme
MGKERRLIIVGDGVFAQVAYEFFTHDSRYEVVAFSVEREYVTKGGLFGLPVVAFEDLESSYAPAEHSFYAAVVFRDRNRLRERLYREAKGKGYAPASYVSSRALVHPRAEVGEHCLVCEATVVEPGARVEDNVVLWSGNHVGHHAVVGRNTFTLPHAVICEYARVGENCVVGPNVVVGAGAVVEDGRHLEAGEMVSAPAAAEQG